MTSISFQNLASSNSWGADLTLQLRLSPRFSALSNFSQFEVVTDGGSTSAVWSNAVGWIGRLNLAWMRRRGAEGNLANRAPLLSGNRGVPLDLLDGFGRW